MYTYLVPRFLYLYCVGLNKVRQQLRTDLRRHELLALRAALAVVALARRPGLEHVPAPRLPRAMR